MDRLIMLADGTLVPLSKVARIRRGKWGDDHGCFLSNDADQGIGFTLDGDVYPCVVIPAAPEFLLLSWGFSAEFWYERLTVVAWRIGQDQIVPITADSVSYDQDQSTWAILDPNGVIIEPGLGTYDMSVEDYLQRKQDEHRKREEGKPDDQPDRA